MVISAFVSFLLKATRAITFERYQAIKTEWTSGTSKGY